jgi:glycerol uptake facilitator protein
LTDEAALTLLINAVVIGLALAAAITAVGSISGAHLNPAVTVSVAMERGFPCAEVPMYIGAQLVGALIGVVSANLIF